MLQAIYHSLPYKLFTTTYYTTYIPQLLTIVTIQAIYHNLPYKLYNLLQLLYKLYTTTYCSYYISYIPQLIRQAIYHSL